MVRINVVVVYDLRLILKREDALLQMAEIAIPSMLKGEITHGRW